MPYIKRSRAFDISSIELGSSGSVDLFDILNDRISTGGELNYAITRLLVGRLSRLGVNYENLKAVAGDGTEAVAEFRRILTAEYEDEKRSQTSVNTDPYECL